jgi:hypothetical protein
MYVYHIRLRAQKTEIQLSSTFTKKSSRQNMQKRKKKRKVNRQIIIYYDKQRERKKKHRKLITFVWPNMRKQRDEINRQLQQTVACA